MIFSPLRPLCPLRLTSQSLEEVFQDCRPRRGCGDSRPTRPWCYSNPRRSEQVRAVTQAAWSWPRRRPAIFPAWEMCWPDSQSILKELAVDCDLALPGVYEIGRSGGLADSPISWSDSGMVRAVKQVPGGMIDPGKMVSGLARAAEKSGAQIFENVPVEKIEFEDPVRLAFFRRTASRAQSPRGDEWNVSRTERSRRPRANEIHARRRNRTSRPRLNSRAWGWLPKGHSTQSIFRTCGEESCARAASSSAAASSTWMIGANSQAWMSSRGNRRSSSPGSNPVSALCTRHCKMCASRTAGAGRS